MRHNFILYLFVRIELFAFVGVAFEQQRKFAGGLNAPLVEVFRARAAAVSSNVYLFSVLFLGKDIVNMFGLLQQFRAKLL